MLPTSTWSVDVPREWLRNLLRDWLYELVSEVEYAYRGAA